MRPQHVRPVIVADGHSESLEALTLGMGTYSEAWLQGLIHKHPDCLPVAEIEPGFGELVSAGMEIPTKHGPIDNLFITPQGQIVLVEAKLWHNPQARREVVAQALDYASCLFEWNYEALEQAILKASFAESGKPDRLYELVADRDALALPAFVDAVNTNLAKGRILILVVGDGIRTEARTLTSTLQSHAGAHFTFALIELNVFRTGDDGRVLVCPRILAQTEMISRGVVEVLDRRTIVSPPDVSKILGVTSKPAVPQAESITADEFYEAMAALRSDLPDKIRAFLGTLQPLGVDADYQRSLNLRWEPPSGRPINLGYIQRGGQVWTEQVNAHAPQDLAHTYVEDLASAFGMDVEKEAFKPEVWHVRAKGRAPRITEITDKLDLWAAIIEKFTTQMRQRLANQSS